MSQRDRETKAHQTIILVFGSVLALFSVLATTEIYRAHKLHGETAIAKALAVDFDKRPYRTRFGFNPDAMEWTKKQGF